MMGKTIKANKPETFAYKRAAAIREYRQLLRNIRGRGERIAQERRLADLRKLDEYEHAWLTRANQLKAEYSL